MASTGNIFSRILSYLPPGSGFGVGTAALITRLFEWQSSRARHEAIMRPMREEYEKLSRLRSEAYEELCRLRRERIEKELDKIRRARIEKGANDKRGCMKEDNQI